MWGARMALASGLPATWEQEVLREFDLSPDDFVRATHVPAHGMRRPMRAILTVPRPAAVPETPVADLDAAPSAPGVSTSADEFGSFIRVSFDLPPGCFATIVLREIMKPEQTGAALDPEPEPPEPEER
jgi:tRNA(Glu) U13 pseudouridine synthase TruD